MAVVKDDVHPTNELKQIMLVVTELFAKTVEELTA